MADVKWIKIVTDIFDDEKMAMIDGLPERDGIIVIWFKLLCMAGKQNNGGVFILNDKIAYTDEMLSMIFRRPLNTVRLALTTFEQYGMIEIVDNVITIPNWSKHQALDAYERKKERDRLRIKKKRAEQKALAAGLSPDCSPTTGDASPDVAPIEEEREEEKEEEKEIDEEEEKKRVCDATHSLMAPERQPDGNQMATQNRKGKSRGKKSSGDKGSGDKGSEEETTRTLFDRLHPDYHFSPALVEEMTEWITYKMERNDSYTEQGMKSLLRQVEKAYLAHGERPVCELIDECMANNWKGIIFDRLKKAPPPQARPPRSRGNVFLDMLADEG